MHVELLVNASHVGAHGIHAHEEDVGDLFVLLALG